MQLLADVLETAAARDGAATIALLATVVVLRQLVVRQLRATDLPLEVRRRWHVTMRSVALTLFLVGTAVIWADQLRTVAVSVLAFAVAIVIATKELLMCVAGSVLRSSGGLKIGARIEIAGFRGDIVDIGALTTTLAEVGPGPSIHQATGRALVFPNSLFLTQGFANEAIARGFVFHTFVVPVGAEGNWAEAERRLLAATREVTGEYRDEAEAALLELANDRSIDPPSAEPRVWLRIVDPTRTELTVRFIVPERLRGRAEQEILRAYLSSAA
jgi:small-conductance mechanosensitive channel